MYECIKCMHHWPMYEPWDAPARSRPTLLLLWELSMVLHGEGRVRPQTEISTAVFEHKIYFNFMFGVKHNVIKVGTNKYKLSLRV